MHPSKRWLAVLVVSVASASVLAASPVGAADTTLKNVMKKMGATATAGDTSGLVPLLDQAKAAAKPDYANWGAIADKGRAAAAKGDLAAAKATCKECHDAYRSDYKSKYGSKAP